MYKLFKGTVFSSELRSLPLSEHLLHTSRIYSKIVLSKTKSTWQEDTRTVSPQTKYISIPQHAIPQIPYTLTSYPNLLSETIQCLNRSPQSSAQWKWIPGVQLIIGFQTHSRELMLLSRVTPCSHVVIYIVLIGSQPTCLCNLTLSLWKTFFQSLFQSKNLTHFFRSSQSLFYGRRR